MAEISINGVRRTEFGKGASRRARRDGLVPAVIYGHGEKPRHITLPAKEMGVALKQANVLLDISIDGKNELTLPKAIVRDPLKQILEHIDLVLVRRGEIVVVSVPPRARFPVIEALAAKFAVASSTYNLAPTLCLIVAVVPPDVTVVPGRKADDEGSAARTIT